MAEVRVRECKLCGYKYIVEENAILVKDDFDRIGMYDYYYDHYDEDLCRQCNTDEFLRWCVENNIIPDD